MSGTSAGLRSVADVVSQISRARWLACCTRYAYCISACELFLHSAQIGLLPRGNQQQVAFAYKMYTRADEIGWKQSNAFKKAFSRDVSIQFVGVWYVSTIS